jgi:hypothetical protein
MTTRFLVAGALAIALAGCTSQSQLTSNTPLTGPTITVKQQSVAVGSTTIVSFVFTKTDLPADIQSATNPQVVLGGKTAPLTNGQAPNTMQAVLPPMTPPPTPDSGGNVVLLIQNESGSRYLIKATLSQQAPFVVAPSTASAGR